MKSVASLSLVAALAGFSVSPAMAQSQVLSASELTSLKTAIAVRGESGSAVGQSSAAPSSQELTRRLNSISRRVQDVEAPAPVAKPVPAPRSEAAVTPLPSAGPIPAVAPLARAAPVVEVAPQDTPIARQQARRGEGGAQGSDVLSGEDIAALPFRIDLYDAELSERSSGPDAKVYSVKKDGQTLLMIYAGPRSQYPIYDGQRVTLPGRESLIVQQGSQRIAIEHLFRRDLDKPADVHIWLMAMDGPMGVLAERIGQSVDPR